VAEAGGKEITRDRWLTRDELIRLFAAIRTAKGFSRQNEITFKALLALWVISLLTPFSSLSIVDLPTHIVIARQRCHADRVQAGQLRGETLH